MITPSIGQAQPGTAIGLMIELGDEHLIALLQGSGNGGAQGIIQRGHVVTERDAVRIFGAEKIGENGARRRHAPVDFF